MLVYVQNCETNIFGKSFNNTSKTFLKYHTLNICLQIIVLSFNYCQKSITFLESAFLRAVFTLWTYFVVRCYYVVAGYSIWFRSMAHFSACHKRFRIDMPATANAKFIWTSNCCSTYWSSYAILNCVGTKDSLNVLCCWCQHLLPTFWTKSGIALGCESTHTLHFGSCFLQNIKISQNTFIFLYYRNAMNFKLKEKQRIIQKHAKHAHGKQIMSFLLQAKWSFFFVEWWQGSFVYVEKWPQIIVLRSQYSSLDQVNEVFTPKPEIVAWKRVTSLPCDQSFSPGERIWAVTLYICTLNPS